VRKQRNYCCRHVTIPVILLHSLHSLVCKTHCLTKRSFQGRLSAVPMQPSFCEFASFMWRHLTGPQRRCPNIVLFKVCHPESNIITHVWPAVASNGTSLLIHRPPLHFSGPCRSYFPLLACLESFRHGMQT
jgi:hypothetical protein